MSRTMHVQNYIYIYITHYIHTHAYLPTSYLPTYLQTDRQTYRPTDRPTYRPTDRQTDIHTYRHTDIQTYRHTYIQTDRHTYIHKCILFFSYFVSARRFVSDITRLKSAGHLYNMAHLEVREQVGGMRPPAKTSGDGLQRQ